MLIFLHSDGVNVIKTDYTPESLRSAFTGQDVVISLISMEGLAQEHVIIDAAAAAGIKRFFPAQYGSDSSSAAVRAAAPILEPARQAIERLRKTENKMSWTSLIVGAFFDMCLETGFVGINLRDRNASVWDDGDVPFATTNRSTVAKAMVAALSGENYDKTKNQYVKVRSHVQTLNDIVASLRRVTGEPWPVVAHPPLAPFVENARAKLVEGDFSQGVGVLFEVLFGKGRLGVYEPLWNETLGLPKEELDGSVRAVVKGN